MVITIQAVPLHTMKAYGKVDVKLHLFLTWTLTEVSSQPDSPQCNAPATLALALTEQEVR
jgi:hypothetical protein